MFVIAGGIILGWLGILAFSRLMLAHDIRKLKRALAPAPPIEGPEPKSILPILAFALAGVILIVAVIASRPRPMAQQLIQFEGQVHAFPADFSDAKISAALSSTAAEITVSGPGGVNIRFPAGTDDATINSVMAREFGAAR